MTTIDEPVAFVDRRRFPRVRLNMLVQFRVDSYEDFLKEYATDLGVGGMFVHTDTPREHGSMIYFQFMIRGGRSIIQGLGRVVHVNPSGGQHPSGMGIEFVSLDDDTQAVIQEIIDHRSPD